MAGTITHEWNGTTLIITSDSGTSSCDLKGDKGDMGIRGAQAPAFEGLSMYPVGAIYVSTKSTSPASFIGGSWERIKDKFLLAAGDTYAAGSTGGSKTHTHTTENMWADIYAFSDTSQARQFGILGLKAKQHSSTEVNFTYYIQDNNTLARTTPSSTTANTYGTSIGGKTDSTSTLPPYMTVYAWQRVS